MKKMQKFPLRTLITLLGIVLSIVLDQWIKQLAVTYLKPMHSYPIWDGVFQLTYVENHGAAFGIFSGEKLILIGVTGLLLVVMLGLLLFQKIKHPCLLWSFGLIISGGIGNLIDRVANGYVVDYLHVTLINFAVFNFADCCVVIGTGLLLIYFIFFDHRDSVSSDSPSNDVQEDSNA